MCETAIGAVEELTRLLAHPVRRDAVAHLAANPSGATLGELADAVAEAGGGANRTSLNATLTLHHVHLPKLEAAGLVRYDAGRKRIDPTVDEREGRRVWRTVTAVDGVLTLVERDAVTASATEDRLPVG